MASFQDRVHRRAASCSRRRSKKSRTTRTATRPGGDRRRRGRVSSSGISARILVRRDQRASSGTIVVRSIGWVVGVVPCSGIVGTKIMPGQEHAGRSSARCCASLGFAQAPGLFGVLGDHSASLGWLDARLVVWIWMLVALGHRGAAGARLRRHDEGRHRLRDRAGSIMVVVMMLFAALLGFGARR